MIINTYPIEVYEPDNKTRLGDIGEPWLEYEGITFEEFVDKYCAESL